MRSESCPNCGAQIVLYPDGFTCSLCDYNLKQWTAFLTSGHPDRRIVAAVLSKLPMHTDSPALEESA